MPGQVEAERRQSIDLDLSCDQQIGGGWRTITFVDSHRSGMIVYKEKKLLINSGKPIAEIARDLGISDGTLGNWMKAAKKRGDFKEKPLEIDERARLKGRGKPSSFEDGTGDPKKAAAWFAKESM
jgi:transposase